MALKGTFSERAKQLCEERGKQGQKVTIRDLLAIANEEERQSGQFLNYNLRICWALDKDMTSREYAEAASYLEFKTL